jgi:hypothetical protein
MLPPDDRERGRSCHYPERVDRGGSITVSAVYFTVADREAARRLASTLIT